MADEIFEDKITKYVCLPALKYDVTWCRMWRNYAVSLEKWLYLLIFPQTVVKLDHLRSSNGRENRNRF